MDRPHVERVYLELEPARITEYGKRWLEEQRQWVAKFRDIILDISKLAEYVAQDWPAVFRRLEAEGCPTAVSSGYSKYAAAKIIDHAHGKTSWTMPTTVAISLLTVAPTSSSTGATITEAAYSTFARVSVAGAGWNAATAADPSVGTNNGAITFAGCTSGTSTLLGFGTLDSATLGAGNMIEYGSLTSTVISTVQTPPTIADTAYSTSLTGT